jgi:hypothetical protein
MHRLDRRWLWWRWQGEHRHYGLKETQQQTRSGEATFVHRICFSLLCHREARQEKKEIREREQGFGTRACNPLLQWLLGDVTEPPDATVALGNNWHEWHHIFTRCYCHQPVAPMINHMTSHEPIATQGNNNDGHSMISLGPIATKGRLISPILLVESGTDQHKYVLTIGPSGGIHGYTGEINFLYLLFIISRI